MMKKIVLTLFTTVILFGVSMAQNAKIEFTKETHDFGQVEETGGPVEYRFVFKNTGAVPLQIQDVKASCGCTTPSWTRDPVMPGKTGHIVAKYNPANRPGAFTKSLTVTSNAENNITRVFIKGMVNPKDKTPDTEYPVKIGNIRTRYKSLHMGDVSTKSPVTKKFDIYNDSDQAISFMPDNVPDFIKVSFEPQTIPAKSVGKLVLEYDGKARNDFGSVIDRITIKTDEATDNVKDFKIQASIKEYFAPMTAEQLANAPKLSITEDTHDFGTIKTGAKVERSFLLTNTGKSNLNIRTTKSTCGCTVATLPKNDIKPGESVKLNVVFDSTDRRGTQRKSVNIYTNDPQKPAQRVVLKGKVTS